MNPKVSIIVPNYNHFRFLEQRLETVFNQTFQDFEVILLDDKSTDDSLVVLDRYAKHPKVSHFIVNEENSGSPFKQWKKGIQLAQGDYIWIAESDDSNDLTFLKSCMHQFEKNNTIGIVATSLTIIEGNVTSIFTPMPHGFYEGKEVIEHKMLCGNSFRNASGIVFLKQALNLKAITDLQYFRICGDWWLWVHILKSYNLFFLEPALTNYLKHDTSTTNNLWNNKLFYKEVIFIVKEVIKWRFYSRVVLDNVVAHWMQKLYHFEVEKAEKIMLLKNYKKLYSIQKRLQLIKNKCFSIKTYGNRVKKIVKYFYNKQ